MRAVRAWLWSIAFRALCPVYYTCWLQGSGAQEAQGWGTQVSIPSTLACIANVMVRSLLFSSNNTIFSRNSFSLYALSSSSTSCPKPLRNKHQRSVHGQCDRKGRELHPTLWSPVPSRQGTPVNLSKLVIKPSASHKTPMVMCATLTIFHAGKKSLYRPAVLWS